MTAKHDTDSNQIPLIFQHPSADKSISLQTVDSADAPLNPLRRTDGAVPDQTSTGPVRATRTRLHTAKLRARMAELQPERRLPQRPKAVGNEVMTSHLLSLLPTGIELNQLTIQHGWDVYLALPRGNGRPGINAERSASDLGNKRLPLKDLALRETGNDDLTKAPLSILARNSDDLNLMMIQGTTTRLGHPPDSKRASNLRSDLKTICVALAGLLDMSGVAPQAALLIRKIQKGRWQQGYRADQWPTGLRRAFEVMKEAYTDPDYTGPGYRFFTTNTMRPISLENISTRLNRLVDFLVNVEGLDEPTLLDLIDIERFFRFRRWYFQQVTQGGYTNFRHLCSALAKVALYLEASGTLKSDFDLGSKHADALWIQFSDIGRKKLKEGHAARKHTPLEELPVSTPKELLRLAARCQTQAPRTTDGRAPSHRQMFQRLFAAAFFGLGVYMPLRGRNWREMEWGRNLFQRPDGRWQVEFSGDELKNGTYGETIRTYTLLLPAPAVEWIVWWRKQLQIFIGDDFEQLCPLVFPMRSTLVDAANEYRWVRMSHKYLVRCVDDAAIEGLGQRFRPHMIRHCVATHIVSGGRIEHAQQAATLLGDTINTVLKMYFKPDEQKFLDEGYYADLEANS
ncbi:hypothetical protein [Deinococcus sp. UYEF24]